MSTDLDKEIEAAEAMVESLEKENVLQHNFRIVQEFRFGALADPVFLNVPSTVVANTYVTPKGQRAYVKGMDYAVKIVGTLQGDTESTAIQYGPAALARGIQVMWKATDTGSNREWSNDWLPLQMLCSGSVQGNIFGRGHTLVSGGSEIEIQLGLVYFDDEVFFVDLYDDVTDFIISVSLVGFTTPGE